VEHLVVNNVFHRITRDLGLIKNTADDDGIVGCIVVAKALLGCGATPSQDWPGQQTVKVPAIECLKDLFQVVGPSACGGDRFSAPDLSDQMRFVH